MKFTKIKEMSVSTSIILSGLIIGFSIFLTTWIFFGGDNNKQKLSSPTPASINKKAGQNNANNPTSEQLQLIQQQRQQNQQVNPTSVIKPVTE
jgi:hypothetical protein